MDNNEQRKTLLSHFQQAYTSKMMRDQRVEKESGKTSTGTVWPAYDTHMLKRKRMRNYDGSWTSEHSYKSSFVSNGIRAARAMVPRMQHIADVRRPVVVDFFGTAYAGKHARSIGLTMYHPPHQKKRENQEIIVGNALSTETRTDLKSALGNEKIDFFFYRPIAGEPIAEPVAMMRLYAMLSCVYNELLSEEFGGGEMYLQLEKYQFREALDFILQIEPSIAAVTERGRNGTYCVRKEKGVRFPDLSTVYRHPAFPKELARQIRAAGGWIVH